MLREVGMIQICVPDTPNGWFHCTEIPRLLFNLSLPVQDEANPRNHHYGELQNHLTEEYSSACIREAQTQRKWLPLTPGTQLRIWTGKHQSCPVQWHYWVNGDFKECWWHQSWFSFRWTFISHKYLFALLENVKNLVYFHIEKPRMKIAPRLKSSIRPTSHLPFPLLTGP